MKRSLTIATLAFMTAACSNTPAPNTAAREDTSAQLTDALNASKNKANAPHSGSALAEKLTAEASSLPSTQDAPILLYESWPQETTLDNDFIYDVGGVWLNGINSAQSTLDFSEFYTTLNTENETTLGVIVEAIKAAAARGVTIRFIVDKAMYKDDNIVLADYLKTIPGVTLRIIDYNTISGGVQHSKYFIADGKTAYFGSQNFDWRSLQQISEMGARLALPELVNPLIDIFEMDWKLAEDATKVDQIEKTACPVPVDTVYNGQTIRVETVASPKEVLPCDGMWDLPKIISLIDNAQTSIAFQLLDYSTVNYDKTTFTEIDEALQRAAARGVSVRMLVSDWSTANKNKISDLKRLQQVPNIETRMLTVPEHSSGYVPYSRTIHSKFLVVDNDKTWLGTSNWAGDYFYASRNVGIIVTGAAFNADLTRSFDHYWSSEYVEIVDPDKNYPKKVR